MIATQTIKRLEARIQKLEKDNTRDLIEMAERGKELVKIASIVHGCKDLIEENIYNKLLSVIRQFENRCS